MSLSRLLDGGLNSLREAALSSCSQHCLDLLPNYLDGFVGVWEDFVVVQFLVS